MGENRELVPPPRGWVFLIDLGDSTNASAFLKGTDQLPENLNLRQSLIAAHPDLTEADRTLLRHYADVTFAYALEAQADSLIREIRMSEHADRAAGFQQYMEGSLLRYVFGVLTFGLINPKNWKDVVRQFNEEDLNELRREEDQAYGNARRVANQAYFRQERGLFEAGEVLLSESGKALFNRLGDRRETRPRYQLSAQINPAPE